MGDFRHIWNGSEISEPRNWQEMEVSFDFMNRTENASINISGLEFAGDIGLKIIERMRNGLTGGPGIFEGDPYSIEVGDIGSPVFTFDGYLDFADSPEFIGCNGVKVSLKKRRGNDWINDVADGFSFRYLFDKGVITSNDFVKIPYVINYIPDGMQLIILGMSLFMMTKELITSIKALAEMAGDITDAATPVMGVSVGLGAGIVTAWDIGNIILVSIKLTAQIAYTVAIIVAIVKMIEQLIEELVPKKRFHLGMTLYSLFSKSCSHLGLQLSSSVLSERKNWVIMPSKGHKGGQKPEGFKGAWTESGVPNKDDGFDTFGDLIRVWIKTLNCDYKIVNGVFYFERLDFFQNSGSYSLPNVFSDQDKLIDNLKPNTDEAISNYAISWAYDIQDQNTLDNQSGRIFQAITEPIIKMNSDLVNIKNLEDIENPCSMGLRKDKLTKIESTLKSLASTVDGLTGVFGSGTNFASKIEDRKGSLLLSSHFTSRPKIVVMSGDKLANDQRALLSCTKIWNDLHFINSFVEINGSHNQWMRVENVRVPFCKNDFVLLMDNNFGNTVDGNKFKIENLKWRVWEDYATISYRFKEKYTNNLKLRILS